ncbi:MAG: hypothetical protein EPO64_06335 [Nitrospirae bacterium]|nr:MAG: hypothetical protein EPO64_06335 [Nitrospirota bacterium]
MKLYGEGILLGYSERQGKERLFRSVDLYLEGQEPGTMKVGIPDGSAGLVQTCQALKQKAVKVTVEVRPVPKLGMTFFDLVAVEAA